MLLGGDVPEVEHVVEDDIAASRVALEIVLVVQAVLRRRLHDGDQAGGLRQGQVFGGNREELLGSRLDSVGVAAEAGDVEIAEQDFVLRVPLLQADCELHLFQLAIVSLRLCLVALRSPKRRGFFVQCLHDPNVLDQLHRQRRCTALDRTRDHVAEKGSDGRGDVDATMLVEASVFGGYQGILDVGIDIIPADLLTILVEHLRDGHRLLIVVQREDGVLLGLGFEGYVVGEAFEQADGTLRGHAGHGNGGGDQCGDENTGDDAQAEQAGNGAKNATWLRIVVRHSL